MLSLTRVFRVYYMFANMASLNQWRRARGFSNITPARHVTSINSDF